MVGGAGGVVIFLRRLGWPAVQGMARSQIRYLEYDANNELRGIRQICYACLIDPIDHLYI